MCATTYIPYVATKYGIGTVYMATFSYASAVGVAPAMIGSITHTATTVAYTSASDARLKENITDVSNIRETLNKLRPRTFHFIRDEEKDLHIGFIAQDVLPIKPELVLGDGDKPDGTYGLDYDGILALTVKALQEANAKIEQLENRISQLENK